MDYVAYRHSIKVRAIHRGVDPKGPQGDLILTLERKGYPWIDFFMASGIARWRGRATKTRATVESRNMAVIPGNLILNV